MAGAHFTIDTIDTSGLRQIQERVQVMAFQSTPAIADGRIWRSASNPLAVRLKWVPDIDENSYNCCNSSGEKTAPSQPTLPPEESSMWCRAGLFYFYSLAYRRTPTRQSSAVWVAP